MSKKDKPRLSCVCLKDMSRERNLGEHKPRVNAAILHRFV